MLPTPPFLLPAKLAHDGIADALLKIRYDGTNLVQTTLLGLHSSQIELFGALTTLLEIRRLAGVEVIYRSFLETTVDLKALIRNPTFARDRLIRYYLEAIRLAKAAGELEGVTEPTRASLASSLEYMRREVNALKAEGAEAHTVAERFALADMSQYFVEFMDASRHAHSNQSALLARHADPTSEQPGISLMLYRDIPIETYRSTMVLATYLALESAHEIHAKLETGLSDTLDSLTLRCEESLRANPL